MEEKSIEEHQKDFKNYEKCENNKKKFQIALKFKSKQVKAKLVLKKKKKVKELRVGQEVTVVRSK
jgi:hypothetical protein